MKKVNGNINVEESGVEGTPMQGWPPCSTKVLRKSCSSSCSPRIGFIYSTKISFFNEKNDGMRGEKLTHKKKVDMPSICVLCM